jgi:serine protease Do
MENLVGSYGWLQALEGGAAALQRRVALSLVVVRSARRAAGAGIVWRKDGIILTNSHVLNGRSPHVLLPDGRELSAHLIARDPQVDLALLSLPVAPLVEIRQAAPGDLRVGQLVFAIGHPWGMRGYVTAGVLSGFGQAQIRSADRPVPILRTDAALAPGNSGGPLVDTQGALLGLNTMIVGGDQGVAIPLQVLQAFAAQTLAENVI